MTLSGIHTSCPAMPLPVEVRRTKHKLSNSEMQKDCGLFSATSIDSFSMSEKGFSTRVHYHNNNNEPKTYSLSGSWMDFHNNKTQHDDPFFSQTHRLYVSLIQPWLNKTNTIHTKYQFQQLHRV